MGESLSERLGLLVGTTLGCVEGTRDCIVVGESLGG